MRSANAGICHTSFSSKMALLTASPRIGRSVQENQLKHHTCSAFLLIALLPLQVMRRRYNSLDSGSPSTSGRGGYNTYPTSHPSWPPLNQFGYEESWDLSDDGGYTPFPVNLPSGEGAEGHGMELGQMSAGLHLSDSKEIWGKMGQVSPVLFFLVKIE